MPFSPTVFRSISCWLASLSPPLVVGRARVDDAADEVAGDVCIGVIIFVGPRLACADVGVGIVDGVVVGGAAIDTTVGAAGGV